MIRLAPERMHDLAVYIPSIYGPTISALVTCLVLGGRRKLAEFLKYSLVWKVSIVWYIVALFGIPFLLVLVRGLHKVVFPAFPIDGIQIPEPVSGILVGYLMSLPLGPFGEELGWRGFALPRLQKRMNALSASLLLGVIWWAWHLPQLLITELRWAIGGMPAYVFLLTMVPGSILATCVYNNSRGSALLTILFHGAMNYSMGLLGFNSPNFVPLTIAMLWAAAILITVAFGPKRLSRTSMRSGILLQPQVDSPHN
jgi:membrane protease YdiL (CAAX protease family)